MPSAQPSPLRVAIIGGGPGGLGAAIALSALPNVEVIIYEQAKELREVGAGINIGFNCWKVLELLGAAEGVKGHLTSEVLHQNGLTGKILKANARVPEGIIKLRKRLSSLEKLDDGSMKLEFEDETEVIADLVVGGDGIRSVVRKHLFPDHSIRFTGTTIFRVLVPVSSISHIPNLTPATTWWHGPSGHYYGPLVDDESETSEEEQMYEIAARKVVDPPTELNKQFSWGFPATKARVESFFTDYDPGVRESLTRAKEGDWKEFAAFAGSRLDKVIGWDGKAVLVGDASHPLSGAFGSGAAFALEDGWILARAIEYIQSTGGGLKAALEIFDFIRSPYYRRMYEYLDQTKQNLQEAKTKNPDQDFESSLLDRIRGFGGEDKLSWIYGNDIEKVWTTFLESEKDKRAQ